MARVFRLIVSRKCISALPRAERLEQLSVPGFEFDGFHQDISNPDKVTFVYRSSLGEEEKAEATQASEEETAADHVRVRRQEGLRRPHHTATKGG